MLWFADFAAHKPKPTNAVPGITYMLAGATQRSDSDPDDHTSPAITVPPHWMIMWPFDATNHWATNDTSRYRSLHHVVRYTLRAHAYHGTPRRESIATMQSADLNGKGR